MPSKLNQFSQKYLPTRLTDIQFNVFWMDDNKFLS